MPQYQWFKSVTDTILHYCRIWFIISFYKFESGWGDCYIPSNQSSTRLNSS